MQRGADAWYEGGLQQVGDGVWAFLQPNGGWGETNTGLVTAGGASAVIDTPWDVDRMAEFLDLAASHTGAGAPIREAVNTHADGDHWWGNAALPPEARITATATTLAAMHEEAAPREIGVLVAGARAISRLPGRPGAMGCYMAQIFAGVRKPATLRFPDHTFTGSTTVDVAGRALELTEHGPAHTSSDIVVAVPDAGVVFGGDLLFFGSTPILWHGPVRHWVAALDRLLELDAGVYVPGHGHLGTRSDVAELRAYWTWLDERGRERFERGDRPLDAARALLRDPDAGRWSGWLHADRITISLHTLYREHTGLPLRPPGRSGRSKAFGDAGIIRRELTDRAR